MPGILPLVPNEPNYRVGTALDGVQYTLDIRWNIRDSAWYMDVLTADGDMIRAGLKLVLGASIGGRVTDPRFPPGLLRVFDQSHTGVDATLEDMGTRVVVYYFSAQEMLDLEIDV